MTARPRSRIALAAAATAALGVIVIGPSSAGGATPPGPLARYLVEFQPGKAAKGRADLTAVGGKVVLDLSADGAVAAMVPSGRLAGLRTNAAIASIEPDVVRRPLGEVEPYGVALTGADTITAPAPGNRTVCIIDSGLYTGHEDMPANVTGDSDLGGAGPWDQDGFGHGTHVAGTIAAVHNDLGVVGVDPGVNLHIVRVFGDDGLWAYSSTLVAALDKCIAAGANVVNMSLGGPDKSRVEQKAFDRAYANGVLSIAAAGNDGNKRTSYPAGYASVVSVAAVDSTLAHADFSQTNRDVELAAPGVQVLSTLPYISTATVTVNGNTITGEAVEGTALSAGVTAPLVNGGLCDSVGAWSGKVVLCQRGTITFADKVANAQSGGGVAVVIANNVDAPLLATIDPATSPIPAITVTLTDGNTLAAQAGANATVVNTLVKPASGYAAWDGTSMATPHVAGIAALIWSCKPTASAVQVRNALDSSARDLGAAGRDTSFGYGLVQAGAALIALTGGSCNP